MECDDLSSLSAGDLSPSKLPVARRARRGTLPRFADKSATRKSCDESQHSKDFAKA
jgi:hypothetical protein